MEKTLFHRIVSRYRKSKLVNSLLERTGSELNPSKWVFIVGCYNSGTTLLEEILSQHGDVASLNDEGVILTNKLLRPEDFGYNRIWYPVREKLYINPSDQNSAMVASRVKRAWSHFFDKSKKVFVEKSISNSTRIEFLSHYFTPAYFIHIVRNGYAVAEGIIRNANPRKFKKPSVTDYTIEMCAKQWVESEQCITQSLIGKRHITIKYEDLAENPAAVVDSVCRFLEINMLEPGKLTEKFSIHGKTSLISNRNPESFRLLSEDDKRKIKEIAGTTLERYNYA